MKTVFGSAEHLDSVGHATPLMWKGDSAEDTETINHRDNADTDTDTIELVSRTENHALNRMLHGDL